MSKYRAETIERVAAAAALHEAKVRTDSIATNNLLKFDLCEEKREACMDDLWLCEEGRRKDKPWIIVGKVGTVTVCVAAVVAVAVVVKQAVE